MSTLLAESPLLLAFAAALFGLLVGSFLNVVIYRLPREDLPGVSEGRSKCPHCGHGIRWYENVPVISWLALRGRCSDCSAKISIRYPIVELITGMLFVGVFELFRARYAPEAFPWAYLVVTWILVSALLAASVIDLDFQILPDVITKPLMPFGVAASAFLPLIHRDHSLALSFRPGEYGVVHGFFDGVIGLLVGFFGVKALRAMASAIWKREAMGYGDVKLMGGLGAFVGAVGVPLVVLIGSLLGAVFGLANFLRLLLLRSQRVLRRGASRPLINGGMVWQIANVIPFGPALAAGGVAVLLFRSEILHFVMETWPAWLQGQMGCVLAQVLLPSGGQLPV